MGRLGPKSAKFGQRSSKFRLCSTDVASNSRSFRQIWPGMGVIWVVPSCSANFGLGVLFVAMRADFGATSTRVGDESAKVGQNPVAHLRTKLASWREGHRLTATNSNGAAHRLAATSPSAHRRVTPPLSEARIYRPDCNEVGTVGEQAEDGGRRPHAQLSMHLRGVQGGWDGDRVSERGAMPPRRKDTDVCGKKSGTDSVFVAGLACRTGPWFRNAARKFIARTTIGPAGMA